MRFLLLVLAFISVSFANQTAGQQPYQPPVAYAPPQHYYNALPAKINTQIQKMYPGAFITDIDFEPYGYEIELSNRMELHFDKNGNLLGQKYDD